MDKLLLLRPYYGVNIHGDAHGDLGIYEISNNYFPDLSFVSAATIAAESGRFDVQVIDAIAERILPDKLVNTRLDEVNYIILKAQAPTIKLDLQLVKKIKEKLPNCKILFAGHIAKILKSWITENIKEIDFIIEEPMDIFVFGFVNGKGKRISINDFPSPNYNLISYKNFTDDFNELRLCVQASRGCFMKCGYCPYTEYYGGIIEYRETEKVMKDIKKVIDLKATIIQFRDQYFTADRQRVVQLCNEIIKNRLHFKWNCETRIESLDKELVDLMVEAGLEMLCFGVESGNQEILNDFSRAKTPNEKTKEMIAYINAKGVKTLAFYIVGFPKDTWETVRQTYELAKELDSSYVKFSAYEPCVLHNNRDLNIKITPDLFHTFQNTMNVEYERNLTEKEVEYIVQFFSEMYCYEKDSLKNSYVNIKYNFNRFKNFTQKVIQCSDNLESINRMMNKCLEQS